MFQHEASAFDHTKRRSIYLDSAVGTPYFPNVSKVAPAHLQAFNKQYKGNIYGVLKPLYTLMKLMGIFPIGDPEPGVFRVTVQWMAYSVTLFAIMMGIIGYIQWDRVEITKSQEGRFEEAVIDYLFSVYLFPIVINLIVWYEARKLAKVVTDWINFERIYYKVTKKKVELFLANKPLITTLGLPFIACASMVVTHVTMTRFRMPHIIPYCYITSVLYLVGGFWFLQCEVVGKVATQLADDFQAALKHIGPASQVADYRSLWMLLSKLIRDVGYGSGYTLTFLCLYLFLIITLTIYGLLSQLQAGFRGKDIGLAMNAALAVAILFFICDEAHYASNCVRVQFQKKLLLVDLTWMNDDAQQEVNMFLRATEMSPTDMSLIGFFDVNRNLFKSLLATMVTYLVVLLQFQISIPEDHGDNTNSSLIIRTTTQSPK